MELTADIIHGFTSSLLMSRFDNPQPTPEFHIELWDYMCSNNPKVAVAAPRGHAKSTAVTHSYVLANICFRKKKHVLIVSDTEGQAVNFLRDIKNEFIENADLIRLFSFRKLLKETESEIVGEFSDGYKFRVIVKGAEQRVRGIKWRNTRPDLIVGDDLENDEIVMNSERREKFRIWFYNALLPAGSDDCLIRIVGTILHLDSLLERLMPKIGSKDTVVEELKQYSAVPRLWHSVRYKAHNEDYSQILWPEKFSEARLREIREDYVQQGFPEGYSQEYLNYPIDESTAYFQKGDFAAIDKSASAEVEEYYIAGDLAISEKKKSAYTVFAVASVNSKNKLRVRDIIRFRGDSLEIIETIFNLQSKYSPEIFFLEQENIARALGPVLNKEMESRGVVINIEPMTASQDKIKRARALQARMRSGMIEFDKDADWYIDLQQEMLQFPRGAYMDQVDALAWIALGLDKIIEAPTNKQQEEEDYWDEYEETSDPQDWGRNWMTGY